MYSQRRSIRNYCFLGLTLLAPCALQAGAISINSTCYVGNCSNVDSLHNGQSTNGAFNIDYTFSDGDEYDISGTYGASYSTLDGSTIDIDPVVTYIGLGPSLGDDTIQLTMLQDYFDSSSGSWAGLYTESVPLSASGTFGPGSQMSGELFYDNKGVGLVGPLSAPGTYFVTESADLNFGIANTFDKLDAAFDFTFAFDEGTMPGAGENSLQTSAVTPEPTTMVLGGLGVLMVAFGIRRRT